MKKRAKCEQVDVLVCGNVTLPNLLRAADKRVHRAREYFQDPSQALRLRLMHWLGSFLQQALVRAQHTEQHLTKLPFRRNCLIFVFKTKRAIRSVLLRGEQDTSDLEMFIKKDLLSFKLPSLPPSCLAWFQVVSKLSRTGIGGTRRGLTWRCLYKGVSLSLSRDHRPLGGASQKHSWFNQSFN